MTKQTLFLLAISLILTTFSFSQVISNEAFKLSNSYGDLQMRRYISGDLNYKRALVPSFNATTKTASLLINYAGDFSDGVRVMGTKTVFDGNVGIGTATPSEKLQVKGLIKINKATTEDNNSPGLVLAGNDDFLYDGQYINHYGFGFHGYQDGATSFVEPSNSYISGYFGIDFFSSGQNRMRISRDGIVSIGTVERPAGYKLAVAGNIISEEVKVKLQNSGWPDYVFEKNYSLPSLKNVEQQINQYGHLKDIPSAKEVADNGIFLGDMNAKLLQKIEELTLYTIQQQKELETQQEKNKTLEARMTALESHLKN